MKSFISTKKLERNAKKKMKLVALANMVQLNSQDCLDNNNVEENEADSGSPKPTAIENTGDKDDDGFTKITYKKKHNKHRGRLTEEEPERKRSKKSESMVTSTVVSDGGKDSDESSSAGATAAVASNDGAVFTNNKEDPLTMTDEQYRELRRQIRQRQRKLTSASAIRLRDFGEKAQLIQPHDLRIPIFLTDIQNLLMHALIGNDSPCTPERWCYLEKANSLSHTIVLVVEGCSLFHYLANESKFERTNKIFDNMKLEMVLPPSKPNMMIEELAQVPLTNMQTYELIKEYGSLDAAMKLNNDPSLLVQTIFPIASASTNTKSDTSNDLHPEDKFPRTKLLLSALQMVDEGYPIPLHGELNTRYSSYKLTKRNYAPVTNRSPLYGVDCEMCRTTANQSELTRISIVNEKMETVYETLVRPYNKITDYLTQYSGITPEIMSTVTKTLKEVQKEVSDLLPEDAILVGQSLNSDLHAMRMMHPYVIDTSVCYNVSGNKRKKAKLQKLALEFLKESIQENDHGHDSVEDSKATLKLVKMKLANSIEFGDEILKRRKQFEEVLLNSETNAIKQNLFAHVAKRDKRTAILSAIPLDNKVKDLLEKAQQCANTSAIDHELELRSVKLIECESNSEVMRRTREIAMENALLIANLTVKPEELYDENSQKTIEKLDKHISKVWNSVAHNGMLIVLMGGSVECPKGLAMIAIKKSMAEVLKDGAFEE